MIPYYSSLTINDLELQVFLGWSEEEKIQLQRILLDLEIQFSTLPKACHTDKLIDTYCYDHLIDTIRNEISNKRFNLIEHLAFTIYQILTSLFPAKTKILVVLKKYPKIKDFNGPVCFRCGEQ